MPRFHVWVPDELHAVVREQMPDLNVSAVFQDALRQRLGCKHLELACRHCAMPVDHHVLIDERLSAFYREALWRLDNLMHQGGTVEGAARVLKDLALSGFQVSAAQAIPLPRLSRSVREQLRSTGRELAPAREDHP